MMGQDPRDQPRHALSQDRGIQPRAPVGLDGGVGLTRQSESSGSSGSTQSGRRPATPVNSSAAPVPPAIRVRPSVTQFSNVNSPTINATAGTKSTAPATTAVARCMTNLSRVPRTRRVVTLIAPDRGETPTRSSRELEPRRDLANPIAPLGDRQGAPLDHDRLDHAGESYDAAHGLGLDLRRRGTRLV